MISEAEIRKHIGNALTRTDYPLGVRYQGKVRDTYLENDRLIMIATDRQSAFDRVLASVPFKGQILNQTSAFWFENTKDIMPNHMIDVPDPNVMVCRKVTVFPVEIVVRSYLTGVTSTAIWTAYQKGERSFGGNDLPDGMRKNQKLPGLIITPTTKSEHDEKISGQEIIGKKLMTKKQWDFVSGKALELFMRGEEIASKNGLILVDTKYEFGYDDAGNIYLADEIHTPDSSRFWIKKNYAERFSKEDEPENIDKEFLRLWFRDHCDPYKDKILPDAPVELVVELSRRYIRLYEMITGNEFRLHEDGNPEQRIRRALEKAGYL